MPRLLLRAAVLASVLAGAMIATVSAAAAAVCAERDKILATLADKYSEAPVAAGVTADGSVIEVLSAPDGKTWTLIYSYPGGTSCLVASGDAWQSLTPKLVKGPKI